MSAQRKHGNEDPDATPEPLAIDLTWTVRAGIIGAYYQHLLADDDFLCEYVALLDGVDGLLGTLASQLPVHQLVRVVRRAQPSDGILARVAALPELITTQPEVAAAEVADIRFRLDRNEMLGHASQLVLGFASRWHFPGDRGVDDLLRGWRLWRDAAVVDLSVATAGTFARNELQPPHLKAHPWETAFESKSQALEVLRAAKETDLAAVREHYARLKRIVRAAPSTKSSDALAESAGVFLRRYHPRSPSTTNQLARGLGFKPNASADALRNSAARKAVERHLKLFIDEVGPLGLEESDNLH